MQARTPKLSGTARWIGFWYRRATRSEWRGLEVRHSWWLPAEDADQALAKLRAALDLLRQGSPKHFARLTRHARGIFLFPTPGASAQWVESLGLVVIDPDELRRAGTSVAEVAATLVHEATHAWLSSLGVGYEEPIRGRVERVCTAAEIAFAGRVPGAEGLLGELRERQAVDPSIFTHAAHVERSARLLREAGLPEFLIRLIVALGRRRVA